MSDEQKPPDVPPQEGREATSPPKRNGTRGAGRPTKWTQELQDAICEHILAGNYDNVASEAAGLAYGTFKEWMQRGEGNDPDKPQKEPYTTFAAAVRKARHEGQARLVQIIANSAIQRSDDAKWLLERKWSKEWGRRDELKVVGADNGPIKVGLSFTKDIIERDPVTGEARTVQEAAPEAPPLKPDGG